MMLITTNDKKKQKNVKISKKSRLHTIKLYLRTQLFFHENLAIYNA